MGKEHGGTRTLRYTVAFVANMPSVSLGSKITACVFSGAVESLSLFRTAPAFLEFFCLGLCGTIFT